MDPSLKQSAYHSTLYSAAGSAMMSFHPIKQIHQHLCAFHTYSQDHSRHIEAHHYCTHLSEDFNQCVIYDSDGPNARLIGIEYIVSEKVFKSLPKEEKKYWHSHKCEVESGLLQLQAHYMVPSAVVNMAEQPAMLELQKTYGKKIHTWAVDLFSDLPLGPPHLMAAYTSEEQVPQEMVNARDKRLGMSTQAQKEYRRGYLPSYEKNDDANEWEKTGKGFQFRAKPGGVNVTVILARDVLHSAIHLFRVSTSTKHISVLCSIHEHPPIHPLRLTSFSGTCTNIDDPQWVRIFHQLTPENVHFETPPLHSFSAGSSVVVVVTTDPAGIPTTQTISTLPPAGQQTTTTPPPGAPPAAPQATTSPTISPATPTQTTVAPAATTERGPVGQPDPTPNSAGGVTPFTYTTVIDGVTTAVADNFTPTNPRTTPFKPTGTGTVWNYSQWLSSFGRPQATAAAASSTGHHTSVSDHLWLLVAMFVIRCVLLL